MAIGWYVELAEAVVRYLDRAVFVAEVVACGVKSIDRTLEPLKDNGSDMESLGWYVNVADAVVR